MLLPTATPFRLAAVMTLSWTLTASADQVFNETVIVDNALLCVGTSCIDGEPNISGAQGIKLKSDTSSIFFEDTSTAANFPTTDWEIKANDNPANGRNALFVIDATAGNTPFAIEGGIVGPAFYMEEDGDIGLGTTQPRHNLHIVDGNTATIRLDLDGSSGFTPRTWDIAANDQTFKIRNAGGAADAFTIAQDARASALYLASNGNLGVGTAGPNAPLEVSTSEAFTFFRLTAKGAAVNDSVDITYTGGPLGTGQLRYNIVDGDNQEMSLDADGNMVIDGTLTTSGPTCAGGCDRVFDEGYALLSIEQHTDQMYRAGYLPSVGPTRPNAPVNLTEKVGKLLNALEHAHIYISQLHTSATADRAAMATLQRENAALQDALADVQSRLAALESKP